MRLDTRSVLEHKTASGQNIFGERRLTSLPMIVPGGTTSCFASCCSTCTCGVIHVAPKNS
jgi:hypothetical protein